MTEKIGSGSSEGLIEFLDQLVEKGRATSGSITPLKSAVRQVLSVVDGEEKWKETDIRSIDTEDYISRFKNLTIGKYSKESYVSYLSRLNKAKDWYNKFLLNPGWSPSLKLKTLISKKNIQNEIQKDNISDEQKTTIEIEPTNKEIVTNNDLITYPFPLRPGKIVYLYLPLDLTLSEAKRLGKYLESLSIDSQD